MGGTSGQRLPFAQAFERAQEIYETLRPHCARIEIAGSIRRQRPDIGDLEMVCIPRQVPAGLFSDELEVDPDFCAVVRRWHKVKGEPTGKYTQRVLPGGMTLDLFMANPDNWGYQLILRTGSERFNRVKMLPALKARGYVMDEVYIWLDGQIVPASEETDLWAISKLPWMEPWAREV
jgi:DNA polymerase/3'-5' exonuclease PolX